MRKIWRKYYSVRGWRDDVVERTFPIDFDAEMVLDFLERINAIEPGGKPDGYCYVKMSDAIEVPDVRA